MSQAYSDIHINTNLGGANFRERGYVHFKQIRLKKCPAGYPVGRV